MDSVDNTKDFNEYALTKFRNTVKETATRGKCLYCEAVISEERVYCNSECRDSHNRELSIYKKTHQTNKG